MPATLDDSAQLLLARSLYWTVPVVLVLWAVAGVRRWRAGSLSLPAFLRRHAAGLATALAVTVAAPLLSEPRLRMQFDETSLAGTALNMHLHRTAMMGVAAVPATDTAAGGGLVLTDWNLDKRPPLFPFLVSIVHDVTGYRVANAFVVNLGALLLLLGTLAVAAGSRVGRVGGVAAPLLVGAVPLVLGAATSGGFELLATLLCCWLVLAALDYVREPTPIRGQWLLANALLLSQARYESILAAGAVLGLVWLRPRRLGHRRLALGRAGVALLVAAPVLAAPVLLLLWHARDPGFYLESGGRELLSLGNAATNVGPFLAALLSPAPVHALPGILAIVSAALYAVRLLRRRARFSDLLVLAPVLLLTATVWLWFYGDVREPTALRLYLPIAVLAALGPLLAPGMFSPGKARAAAGVAVAVLALALAVPRALAVRAGDLLPQHTVAWLLGEVDAVLELVPHDPARTVWVTTVSQYFVVHGRAAIPPRAFDARAGAAAPFDVYVLTTPLDAVLAGWFGDPNDVLARHRTVSLGAATVPDSDEAIAVHRLQR